MAFRNYIVYHVVATCLMQSLVTYVAASVPCEAVSCLENRLLVNDEIASGAALATTLRFWGGNWRSCRRHIIYIIDLEIREGHTHRICPRRAGKNSKAAAGKRGFRYAELEAPIEKKSHLTSYRPHPDADLTRRARGISAGDLFVDGQSCPAIDALGADLTVAGQHKAIKVTSHAAYDDPIIIVPAAQAGTGRDLSVEITHEQFTAHAGKIISRLNGQR